MTCTPRPSGRRRAAARARTGLSPHARPRGRARPRRRVAERAPERSRAGRGARATAGPGRATDNHRAHPRSATENGRAVLKFATQPYCESDCVNVQAESFVTARGERCLCQARQAPHYQTACSTCQPGSAHPCALTAAKRFTCLMNDPGRTTYADAPRANMRAARSPTPQHTHSGASRRSAQLETFFDATNGMVTAGASQPWPGVVRGR